MKFRMRKLFIELLFEIVSLVSLTILSSNENESTNSNNKKNNRNEGEKKSSPQSTAVIGEKKYGRVSAYPLSHDMKSSYGLQKLKEEEEKKNTKKRNGIDEAKSIFFETNSFIEKVIFS